MKAILGRRPFLTAHAKNRRDVSSKSSYYNEADPTISQIVLARNQGPASFRIHIPAAERQAHAGPASGLSP
jgi:hypothetical protein